MATSGLFCSSAFGPAPELAAPPGTVVNGFAGPSIRPKKNAATSSMTAVAHPMTSSLERRR